MTRNIRIRTANLQIGMFVSGLDRPWIDTPYPLEGIWISSTKEIESINLYSDHAIIDPDKSFIKINEAIITNSSKARPKKNGTQKLDSRLRQELEISKEDSVPIEQEITFAKQLYSASSHLIQNTMDDLKLGKKIDVVGIKSHVKEMLGSILRNSDALSWLTQLRSKDNYTYNHSLNVCINMLNFGEYLALPASQITEVGMVGLLQDVGKMRLPHDLLEKNGSLTENEIKIAKNHVQHSVDLLSKNKDINISILENVIQHHERYNGSGYPKGLKRDQISVFGHMAGIIDCFDAMKSNRPGGNAISPFQALSVLHDLKEQSFHPALVERFIQCIGIYSVGSLIELSTQEIAIVIEQKKERRLRPKVLVIIDADKIPYEQPFTLDLINEPTDPSGRNYSISQVLNPCDFGIDPVDYYL